MSQDGTPETWPCTVCGSSDPHGAHDLVAEAVRERDKIIAAIVTQHGENLGDGRYRLQVAPEHLETAEARRLTVIVDPNSGAMLLRAQPL